MEEQKSKVISKEEMYIGTAIIIGILISVIHSCLEAYHARYASEKVAVVSLFTYIIISAICALYSGLRIKNLKLSILVSVAIILIGNFFRPELISSDVWLHDYYIYYIIGAMIYGVISVVYHFAFGEENKEVVKSVVQLANDEMYCPKCNEIIKKVAKKCRYCGEWLEDSNGGGNNNKVSSLQGKI